MAVNRKKSRSSGGRDAKRGTPSRQRDVLVSSGVALLAAILTVAAVARLFAFGAWLQLGLLAGASAGLLATSLVSAAATGVAAVAVGLSVTLGSFSPQIALPAGVAAVVAPAVHWVIGRRPSATDWIAYAAIAVIVVNVWVTTLYVNIPHAGGRTPVAVEVAQSPKLGDLWNDGDFYRRVLWHRRSGIGYYESYRRAFNENAKWQIDPPSVISYRLPTAFWLWNGLPGGPIALFIAWLILSTAAFAAGVHLATRRVPAAFALPAAAALATYLIYFGTSTIVLFTEAWGAALGIVAVAAVVESFGSKAWRGWTVVAVVLAVVACFVRELMVYLPIAAVMAAVVTGGPERRFRVIAWLSGLGVFAGAYVAHVLAINGAVSGQRTAQALSSGGLEFFAKTFSWATTMIGGGAAMLVLYVVLAVVGIWLLPDPHERWFLAIATALPLAAFLVFGNDAAFANGASTNYWGTVIVPILIVLSPWAVAGTPGADVAAGGRLRVLSVY